MWYNHFASPALLPVPRSPCAPLASRALRRDVPARLSTNPWNQSASRLPAYQALCPSFLFNHLRTAQFASPLFCHSYKMPGVWGYHTCSRLPTTLPLHLCESLCCRRLCVIYFRSVSPGTRHESPPCPELRGATAFKLFGSAECFSISVAAHEQKSALLY